jgi:hypothetical protein
MATPVADWSTPKERAVQGHDRDDAAEAELG